MNTMTRRTLLLASTILAFATLQTALAAPQSGTVVSGKATITQSGNTLIIVQQSATLVINWNSFSIGAGEVVRITQPNAQASILNRVTGSTISSLNGQLLANGIVFIVNPNGIQIGSSGRISAGSFVATTSSIANADFLAGRYVFAAAPSGSSVANAGIISALPGGTVILAAIQVENSGRIEAPQGTVALGAAKTFNVDINGDGLLRYQVGEAAIGAVATNTGAISVPGGQVLIAARSIDSVAREVINVGGLVEANSVSAHNGEIVFDGGATGIVSVTGQVQAQGVNSGETGGTVKVLGETVAVMDNARVDASGAAGGGTVLVGGNWHGEGAEPKSQVAYLAASSVVAADATEKGNGGQVVVWSENTTRNYGTISVKGGPQGGDGGAVEVSSRGALDFQGDVIRTAALGRAGSLLLDPLDFNITAGPNAGPTNMGGSPLEPTAGGASINDGKINNLLGGGSLTLRTLAGGNITMMNNAHINSGSANSLTINSGGDFNGQSGATINIGGSLTITAANQLSYSVGGTVTGNITLSGAGVNLGGGGATTITSTTGYIDVTATGSNITNQATLTANAVGVRLHNPSGGGSQLPPPPPPSPFGGGSAGAAGPGFGMGMGPGGGPGPGARSGPGVGDVLGGNGPAAQGPAGENGGESAFGPPAGEGGPQNAAEGAPAGAPPPGGGGREGPRREPPAKTSVAQVIPGLLQREVAPAPGGNQGVPGVSQRYSSFGNPALW
ncbi:Large exoprotein involved in heme utilization or adhesion [Paramagnetospirillum magnetotacticum MS-1]|uniref:Large exoprotein involved in heme utilization or adhesion n=1 Tax=Paramagnetospirillum magnetotacticum MS-1 TaxID=272627 RepID=A0A0C2YK79_PARME|nr:filamentous hemagglutinin N-terminal domain-containing protein [Paramagnetospirillum magnetotacticum]KIM00155.1 Large exoprotein involved in heme utilization or adhesion [Paramagnetospirillum magnetotacticum MS-1]